MSKLKSLKVKNENGFDTAIDIGADAINISMSNGKNLEETISELKNEKITLVIGDSWTSTEADSVNARDGANNWLYYFEPLQSDTIYQKAEGGSGFVKTGVTN